VVDPVVADLALLSYLVAFYALLKGLRLYDGLVGEE
jgi:hypothetical protein